MRSQIESYVEAKIVSRNAPYEGDRPIPGLKEQVDEALEQIDEYAISQEPDPKQMLDWLMAKSQS